MANDGEGTGVPRRGRPRKSGPDRLQPDPVHHAVGSQKIGIRELRQHASVYVDLVERGHTVDITNRGRLVAQMIPVKEPDSPLERWIAAGVIERAEEAGSPLEIDPYPPLPPGRPTASDVLGQIREGGPAVIYLDSSALVKLALTEPESAALIAYLAEHADQAVVSSALHRTEVLRAIWQAEPGALTRGMRLIRRIGRVSLSADILDNAATLPPQRLGPTDAIHLASALAIKRDLSAFVAYDKRLLEAAQEAGLPTASPA